MNIPTLVKLYCARKTFTCDVTGTRALEAMPYAPLYTTLQASSTLCPLAFFSCTRLPSCLRPRLYLRPHAHPARRPRAPPIHLHARQPRGVAVRPAGRRARRAAPPPQHGRGVRRARTAVHARIGVRGHRVRARGARHGPCVWRRGGGRRAGALAGAAAAVGERADVPRAGVRCGGVDQVRSKYSRSTRGELSAPEGKSAYIDGTISAPHTSTHVLHFIRLEASHIWGTDCKQLSGAIRRLFARFPR